MKKVYASVLVFISVSFLFGCGDSETGSYPVDKKYWNPNDYSIANANISAAKNTNKELPNLDNPKTSEIFNKLVDTNNISVVMNDDQLGVVHRSQFSNEMFEEYRTLNENYSIIDRTDKYQYPVEFAEVLKFGLYLQPYYIGAGNEKILKDADDPKAQQVIDIITRNQNVLIGNYDIYLDFINYEDRFNDKALSIYAQGIREFFPKLISQHAPNGNYEPMLGKIENMLKKAKNQSIITELTNIKQLIDGKVKK